jgi:hypothetical protein
VNFAQAKARLKAPGATLVLPLWVFADQWESKPDAPVCVGLRLLAENDKTQARAMAVKQANDLHPDRGDEWVDCFNDAVQMQIDALGMCDPNDVNKPSEAFEYAEDQLHFRITSKGAAFIFQAIQRYEVASSPIGALATSDDLERLATMLGKLNLATLGPAPSRTITYLIDLLEPLVGELVDAVGVDHTSDEVQLVVSQ